MSKYIDGFVIPIQPNNIEAYQDIATRAGKIWKEYGALEYIEAVGDDLKPGMPDAKSATELFPTKTGETLMFSYIVYKSRAHRDEVNEKVMKDPRMKDICPGQNPDLPTPFDPMRMMFGGFRVIVDV